MLMLITVQMRINIARYILAETENHQRLFVCSADLDRTTESYAQALPPPLPPPPGFKAMKEYVWVVARCSLVACLISFVAGMTIGFSSPALLELTSENLTTPTQQLQEGSTLSSMFGVRLIGSCFFVFVCLNCCFI